MLIQAYWKPCQGRSHCHWWHWRQARRYHHNWRSSSQSCSQNMRHNALQKMYKNEHMDISSLMNPNSPTDGETPPNPSTEGKCPHNILISLKHTDPQGTNNWVWGCNLGGGTPKQGWCKGGVPTQRGAHYNPATTCKAYKNTEAQRSMGAYGGLYTPGVYKCVRGIWLYGGVWMWGVQTSPKYKNMPATKK